MRFQTSETVSVHDPEVVLRALETCLRDISNEVVRSGDQITLHGLGPSPRAVNYNDKTVLSISAEDDKTVINADVSFQASAFLGDASQDAVVRSKLDQVFNQMKSQIYLEKKRGDVFSAAPIPVPASSSPSSQLAVVMPSTAIPLVSPASVAPASVTPTSVMPTSVAGTPVAESSAVALLERTEAPVEDLEDGVPSPVLQEAEEHLDEGEAVSAEPISPSLQEEELQIVHARQETLPEESEARHSKLIWLVSAVVVFFLLVAGAFLPRFRGRTIAWYSAVMGLRHSVATKAIADSPTGVRPAPDTNGATAAHSDSSAPSAANVADPKAWVENWAAAMRSRDPVAQASFYADPVERYIDQKNVTNAALVEEKRADIGRRHELWSFKLNDVVVESRTASEATVFLVKHYVVGTDPSQASELFVKTRLQLKLINGQWKIVSEREIRAATPASVDPIDQ